MGARDGPLAGHGVRDRERLRLGERRERPRRAADVHAAAGEYERALRLAQQRDRGPERFRIGTRPQRRRSAAARVGGEVRGVERMTTVGDVLRDVEHHRTGPPTRRDREGAAHELRNAPDRLDPNQLLRGRAQDLHLPRLLGHVLPGMIAVAVAGDEDQRGYRRSAPRPSPSAGWSRPGRGLRRTPPPSRSPWRRRRPRTRRSVRRSPGCGRCRAGARHRRTAGAGIRPCRTSGRSRGQPASAPALRRRSSPVSRPFQVPLSVR